MPRSRNWIWFFAVLGLLAVAAVAINGVYNMRLQLTPEALAHARELWEKNGPRDYLLEYTKTIDRAETFIVTVRNGETRSVVLNPGEQQLKLEARQYRFYGMDALFDDIDTLLKRDAQPGSPRAFNQAVFDPGDGHLIYYARNAGKEHVHITVKRLEPGKHDD
jgi:Family of unknown function (DUF6174)